MQKKYYQFFFLTFALFAVLLFLNTPPTDWQLINQSSIDSVVIIRVENEKTGVHTFHIPQEYFQKKPGKKQNVDGFSLLVFSHNHSPLSKIEKDEWRKAKLYDNTVRISVGDGNRFVGMERAVQSAKKGNHAHFQKEKIYGLDHFTRKPEDRGKYDRDDVYVHQNRNSVSSFLLCDAADHVRFPGCAHYFFYKRLLIRHYFRKHLLSEWKHFMTRTIDILEFFEIS